MAAEPECSLPRREPFHRRVFARSNLPHLVNKMLISAQLYICVPRRRQEAPLLPVAGQLEARIVLDAGHATSASEQPFWPSNSGFSHNDDSEGKPVQREYQVARKAMQVFIASEWNLSAKDAFFRATRNVKADLIRTTCRRYRLRRSLECWRGFSSGVLFLFMTIR